GDEIIEEEGLCIPHKRAHERLFVIEPMAEIAPFFLHPLLKKEMRIIYRELKHG
ncbi:MAG: 2-amino-4-hydroxy-6-hydroxymethyldihydropteridine pyrophosphokinase, partial [Nitrospirae bacterium]